MSSLTRVVLDWETAYGRHPVTDENITLSRMTTEEYVRHKHFKAHGLGVKIGQEKAFYVYGPDLLAFLRSHPWDRTFAIAHHAHFDGAIFSWRAGIRPAFIGDTLSMARAIYPHESHSLARLSILTGAGEKGHELQHFQGKWELTRQEQAVLGGYCCNDVELTAYIFNHLLPHFSADELRNIDWTVRAFTEPVIEVDPAPLIEAYKSERRRKRKLIKQCVSDKTELASNDKFAALLLSLGVDPPKKVSPAKIKDGRVDPDEVGDPPLGILPSFKAPKGASPEERVQLKETKATYPWSYAFGKADEDFKLLQDHSDPQVQAVVEARLGVKSTIKETRTKRFYKIGSRGAFPVYLNYYGGHTGRWCLVGDTIICIEDPGMPGLGVDILLRHLDADDRVWDGEEYVRHGGLVYRGEQEVLTYDRITGTPGHRVFVNQTQSLTLQHVYTHRLGIHSARYPPKMFYGATPVPIKRHEGSVSVEKTYDILDCGPRNRFVANGKLVHNSGGDKQNAQNLNRVDDRDPTSGALRMSWVAPKGHVFVVRDLGQIEARQLVYLAGQEDMLDMFREGGDPYDFMATKIYGRIIDRAHVAADKSAGQVGKIIVLGCLGPDTIVVTNHGHKRIVDIRPGDMLWDGHEFVHHGGVISQGEKECLTANGLTATPDHGILTEHGWQEWHEVLTQSSLFQSAIRKGSSPSWSGDVPKAPGTTHLFGVLADTSKWFTALISRIKKLSTAPFALRRQAARLRRRTGGTQPSSPTITTGSGSSTEFHPVYNGAITPRITCTTTTEGVASTCTPPGWRTAESFSGTLQRSRIGKWRIMRWTGSTILKDMLQVIYASAQNVKMYRTGGRSKVCKKKIMTYDIAYCGPRNCFAVMTDYGPIIVHNCGYQMGAWKLQGSVRVGFMGMPGILFGQEYVDQLGVNVEAFLYQRSYKKGFATAREEADACKPLNISAEDHYMHCAVTKFLIDKFRAENDKVVLLWREAQNALELILSGKYGVQVGDKGLVHTCEEGFILPNGMKIRYYGLRKSSDGKSYKYLANARKKEWTNIYGGKEVENCIAAGTKVLTDSGWKNIENVSIYDLVHDGVDFVRHGGVVGKGEQGCISINRVYMTPDHEVLVSTGWVTAGKIRSSQHYLWFRSPTMDDIEGIPLRCDPGRFRVLERKEVYDIMNCGPLSRFVVLGDSGPFVVHNCVQALSRIILSDQMLRISRNLKEGYVLRHKEVARVVSSTHDEAITIVPERYASDCLYMMGEEMRTPPDWCKDIPLKSSGGFARSYGACEK